MALFVPKMEDAKLYCPECPFSTKHASSLRKHCPSQHGFEVTTVHPLTPELVGERAKRARHRMVTYRAQRAGDNPNTFSIEKRQRVIPRRPRFDFMDAEDRGNHGAVSGLVKYGRSLNQKAGNGVFACVPLDQGDVVTVFEGATVAEQPTDPEYTIEIETGTGSKYLDGIRCPEEGRGLGSFVNKESRIRGLKRKNCEMVQIDQRVYIEITRSVSPGEELYTTYSKGYRLKIF